MADRREYRSEHRREHRREGLIGATGRFGGLFPAHPEEKQWALPIAKPSSLPTPHHPHVPRRAQPVTPHHFPRTFASLFSRQGRPNPNPQHRPHRPRDIPPLPHHPPTSRPEEDGWHTVVRRRRNRRAPYFGQPPPPSPKKCFFCHASNHMARDCPRGSFVCFSCHGKGHIAIDCPLAARLSALPPILQLPAEINQAIVELSSFAIFYLAEGHPSIQELREMLAYRFNLQEWPHKIARASGTSFMVQFPSDELLEHAEELKIIDMGSFKGRFLRWREDLSLKTLPEPFYVWIRLYKLPFHLWDWDFIQTLLREVGECVMCSDDINFHDNFSNCKILIKIRDLADIPRRLRFRYISPIDGSLMEGLTMIQIIGKPVTRRAFEKPEVQEHQAIWQGSVSTESGWAYRGNQTMRSTNHLLARQTPLRL